eukprot:COSAG05_NODE_2705_length_2744_cov_5.486578_3_plen_172_part_00
MAWVDNGAGNDPDAPVSLDVVERFVSGHVFGLRWIRAHMRGCPSELHAHASLDTASHVLQGYTSTAGYEPTGHKKTNQDAFCVFEVRMHAVQHCGPCSVPAERAAVSVRRILGVCAISTFSACSMGMAVRDTNLRIMSRRRCDASRLGALRGWCCSSAARALWPAAVVVEC